jgi:hypothetical protein
VDVAVLASAAADERARAALERACERIPALPTVVADADRATALRALAARPEIAWIVVADADAFPLPDAFGRLRRSLGGGGAILGGRGVVAGRPQFGAMFAPPRYGPHPFELSPVAGLAEERGLADIIRGPVDVPQRGLFVVSAAFVRGLPAELELDPVLLHLDLAVQARVAGATVSCEPTMSFATDEASIEVRRRLLRVGRFASYDVWDAASLHREPKTLRSLVIDRDTRIMGNFRGYAKRALPPIETITYGARDAGALRTALARTGDRYVLCAPSGTTIDRPTIERLVERVERSSRFALALERDAPPYGAVLVNAGRLAAGGQLRGDTSSALFADAVATLPQQRLYAVGPSGPIVPDTLPPLPPIASLDVIFVAGSQPIVTNQTIASLMQERVTGVATAVFPAGLETLRRVFSSYGALQLAPDPADPILAVGLNHAIAACRSDAIAIVRDDVQVTYGVLQRLCDAFARVARLGVAAPRTGGAERLESLPDVSYGNAIEMQAFAERRAEQFAREAMLVDAASVPALVVSRAAFEIVGGFDESFGFSRFGIEDFTRRVRAANLHVARCDDAYVHMFPREDVQSFLAPLDTSPQLFESYRERWSVPRGFDPARDVVPLRERATAPDAPAAPAARVRLLVPVGSEAEWTALAPEFAPLATALRADDPVDIAIGLDGTFALGAMVAALRDLLVRSGVPMEETVNVRVEPVGDLGAWRDAHDANVRLARCDRPELAAVPVAADVAALRALVPQTEPA